MTMIQYLDHAVVDIKPASSTMSGLPSQILSELRKMQGMLDELSKLHLDEPAFIFVKVNKKFVQLQLADIEYVEAFGDYTKLHKSSNFLLANSGLRAVELKLQHSFFVRIHRSVMVNIHYIQEMTTYFNGEMIVLLKSGKKLKVSRGYKENFMEKIKDKYIL